MYIPRPSRLTLLVIALFFCFGELPLRKTNLLWNPCAIALSNSKTALLATRIV